MKKRILIGGMLASLTLALGAAALDDQSIPDDALGLTKGSVYDVPSPDVFEYRGDDPGANQRLDKSYPTAPPMIPHKTADMLPITQESNLCKDCHVQPDLIGKKLDPGMPVPAPASHYVSVKKAQLYMGRWNCTQCHREQANVKLLVESTFKKPGAR